MNQREIDTQSEIALLADAIYRDKVLRARRQDPVQKLLDGFDLFARGLELTRIDVARTIGTSDDAAVQEALGRRFERVRRARESGLYKTIASRS